MRTYFFILFSVLPILFPVLVKSQACYWVSFTDKNNTPYSLAEPEVYLSERALQRRQRQHIAIDSLDLPVNPSYSAAITGISGVKFLHASKWLNGITVTATSDSMLMTAKQFPFVKDIQLTKPAIGVKSGINKWVNQSGKPLMQSITSNNGPSVYQTTIMNGQYIHNQGFWGEGMQIAILDAGFFNVDTYPAFDSLWANNQILGTRDFVNPDDDFFKTNYHGMSVLSCIGGNIPGQLLGTGPKASFWLLRSEDVATEYLIEEDNWIAAAEFADSVGCDIINSSLGYSTFDAPAMNHKYTDMDGKTTRVTRGANIAASRGMLVFVSAGNEGNKPWKYITAPADGDNVIAVGAVNRDSLPAPFTSLGPAADGDIKPNVTALGWNTYLEKRNGETGYSSGTSFSSPVMAGMAACLWQANTGAKAETVKNIIELTASQSMQPDSRMGYGIPNMQKAFLHIINLSEKQKKLTNKWNVFPNPIGEAIFLTCNSCVSQKNIQIELYSIDGRLLRNWIKPPTNRTEIRGLQSLPRGIFLLKINHSGHVETFKLNKVR